MQLKFNSIKEIASVWKSNFLGHRGFFLPGQKKLKLGQKLDVEVFVEGSSWGKVNLVVVWYNWHGVTTQATPRGVFLRVINAVPEFEKQINNIS